MDILLLILVFIVALLYAAVGHGGASGYLALMALYSCAPEVMKPTALMLNLFVSLTSFIQYYRAGYYRAHIFLPLALTSVPLSFLGGYLAIDGVLYKQILGILLLFAAIRFWLSRRADVVQAGKASISVLLLIGAAIGFLSGLIGIGGGILLSPVLILLAWADQKQTAAISAIFIFVNSLAGLGGQWAKGLVVHDNMIWFVLFAVAGGWVGAYWGAGKFPQLILKKILGVVLLLAAIKLITAVV
jgi:uncharacterized membrane protein YfcA